MFRRPARRTLGFTLIEMAIVLGVAGILFGGLWRLLSNGNGQMRDQATASQQAQLIGAISTYLQTTEGQAYMAAIPASGSHALALPSTSTNAAGSTGCTSDANMTASGTYPTHIGLCGILPPGTWASTANPYGQTFLINILKDSSVNLPIPTPPKTYSFMIETSGGDTIPDTSGGRIGAMIGGDGGFIYGSNVCGSSPSVASWACGAYGAWAEQTSFFGLTGASGHVASRTFYSPSQSLSDYWLARKAVPGDTTAYTYNTMTTPFYLGGSTFNFSAYPTSVPSGGVMNVLGGTIYMNSSSGTTGGGNFYLDGGLLDLGTGGSLVGDAASTSGASAAGGATLQLSGAMGLGDSAADGTGGTQSTANPALKVINTSTCNQKSPSDKSCTAIAQIQGDVNVSNLLSAFKLYSQTFLYNTSDVRLKRDIQPLVDPLADVMKLKPVSYALKQDGQQTMGVTAQDLEKVYPQLVGPGFDGYKAVAYDGLIAPLIGSVQELKQENDDLRALLKAQAARQEKMERELDSLRRQ